MRLFWIVALVCSSSIILGACTTVDDIQDLGEARDAGKALIGEDLEVTRAEREAKREVVEEAVEKCMDAADDAATWAEAKPIYEDCLAFMAAHGHELVVERLPERFSE